MDLLCESNFICHQAVVAHKQTFVDSVSGVIWALLLQELTHAYELYKELIEMFLWLTYGLLVATETRIQKYVEMSPISDCI